MAERFAPAAGVRTLELAGRHLLFTEDRQQIFELNDTAGRIWRALTDAGSLAEAAAELVALGAPAEQAFGLVGDAAAEWTREGYLAPSALSELLDAGRPPDRTLVLDELAVELRFGAQECEALDAVFGHFYSRGAGGRRPRRLSVLEHAGQVLFYVERRLAASGPRDGLAAHAKAVLTDLYADEVEDGFLTHGALLQHEGRRLLLSGEPGAGKTTLTLALAAAGWRYGSDDIVRIGPDGAARGVPFAAAVKDGSLPLLAEAWPELAHLRAWLRCDGRHARYLLPADRAAAASGPLDVVVLLARRPGAAAVLSPISTLDALSAIVADGYARRWRMTGEALSALGRTLERAACVRLEYSELGSAVQAIGEIGR